MMEYIKKKQPSNKSPKCEPVLAVGRLTKAKLIKWINYEFQRVGIKEYEVYAIEQTRYRSVEYEAGAAFLHIRFRSITNHDHTGLFLCFYKIKQLEDYLKNGYSLTLQLDWRKGLTLTNLELEVCKPYPQHKWARM